MALLSRGRFPSPRSAGPGDSGSRALIPGLRSRRDILSIAKETYLWQRKY